MKRCALFSFAALFCLAATAEIPLSNRKEGEAAVQRATQWLLSQQKEDGHWSNPQWPALTGFPVWALSLTDASRDSEAVRMGVAFLLSHARENGGIYVEPREELKGGGMSNYNTAICMVALHLSQLPDTRPAVLRARRFVAASQHLGGDVYRGGFGYDADTKRAYADLSNTYIALEGLKLTENAEDASSGPRPEINKEAAAAFVSSIQNRRESNPADWVSDHPVDKDGFAYRPDDSRGMVRPAADGKEAFRSFGSMTYAGMLSLIYADVDRNDDRIKSAFGWARRNWSVKENPPADQEGYYYFINVLSKCMAVIGQDTFTRENGDTVHWRVDVINELVARQKTDENGNGYWVNPVARYWEGDPVLSTAYALIALQVALQE